MAGRRSARRVGAITNGAGTSAQENMAGSIPGILAIMQKMMKDNQQVMQGMLTQIQQQAARPIVVTENRPEPGAKQFHELHPKTFSGTGGPLVAEEWIRNTEDKLAAARVPQAGWVEIAQLQLTDNARNWWEAEEKNLMRPIPWGLFKERLLEKYFPASTKQELMRRFANLKQENMTVDEYVTQFETLSRFAPHMIETEELKVFQFRQGLHPQIRIAMACIEPATLMDAVKYARNYEREAKLNYEPQTKGIKQQSEQGRNDPKSPLRLTFGAQIKKPAAPRKTKTRKGPCHHCKKMGHVKEECRKLHGLCWACGDPTHAAADCPKSTKAASQNH